MMSTLIILVVGAVGTATCALVHIFSNGQFFSGMFNKNRVVHWIGGGVMLASAPMLISDFREYVFPSSTSTPVTEQAREPVQKTPPARAESQHVVGRKDDIWKKQPDPIPAKAGIAPTFVSTEIVPAEPEKLMRERHIPDGYHAVPGWKIGILPWTENLQSDADAVKYVLVKNGRFDMNSLAAHTPGGQYMYRFDGYLNVKEAGRYLLGAEADCFRVSRPGREGGSECQVAILVEDRLLVRQTVTEGGIVAAGQDFEPGIHKVAILFAFGTERQFGLRWGKLRDAAIRPVIRTEHDLEPRNFTADELFTLVSDAVASSR